MHCRAHAMHIGDLDLCLSGLSCSILKVLVMLPVSKHETAAVMESHCGLILRMSTFSTCHRDPAVCFHAWQPWLLQLSSSDIPLCGLSELKLVTRTLSASHQVFKAAAMVCPGRLCSLPGMQDCDRSHGIGQTLHAG